jgi:hypothetical protein
MRIYSDLDNVLINPMEDAATGEIISIVPRPDVDWFLRELAKDGEVWILTAAEREHADRALEVLGDLALPYLAGVLSAEDLYPAWSQVDMILGVPEITDEDRAALLAQIPPVAPAGVIFDDWPLRSKLYYVKTSAVGVGPEKWIEVEPFSVSSPDRGGLRRAHADYVRRFGSGAALAGGLRWA